MMIVSWPVVVEQIYFVMASIATCWWELVFMLDLVKVLREMRRGKRVIVFHSLKSCIHPCIHHATSTCSSTVLQQHSVGEASHSLLKLNIKLIVWYGSIPKSFKLTSETPAEVKGQWQQKLTDTTTAFYYPCFILFPVAQEYSIYFGEHSLPSCSVSNKKEEVQQHCSNKYK